MKCIKISVLIVMISSGVLIYWMSTSSLLMVKRRRKRAESVALLHFRMRSSSSSSTSMMVRQSPRRILRTKVNIDALIESFLQTNNPGSEPGKEEALLSSLSPSPASISSSNSNLDASSPSPEVTEQITPTSEAAAVPTMTMAQTSTDASSTSTTTTSTTNTVQQQGSDTPPISSATLIPTTASPAVLLVSTPADSNSMTSPPGTLAPSTRFPSNTQAPISGGSSSYTNPLPQPSYSVDDSSATPSPPKGIPPTLPPANIVSTSPAVAGVAVRPSNGGASSVSNSGSSEQQNVGPAPTPTRKEGVASPTTTGAITTAAPFVAGRPASIGSAARPMPEGDTSKTTVPMIPVSSSTSSPITNTIPYSTPMGKPVAIVYHSPLPVLVKPSPSYSKIVTAAPIVKKPTTSAPIIKTSPNSEKPVTKVATTNTPVVRPIKTTPPVVLLQAKPMIFVTSPASTIQISLSPSPSPSPLPPPHLSTPTTSNSNITSGHTPVKSTTNVTSPLMVPPLKQYPIKYPNNNVTRPSIPIRIKSLSPARASVILSSPWSSLTSPKAPPSYPSLPSPPISKMIISSSPWPSTTLITPPEASPPYPFPPTPPISKFVFSSSPWPTIKFVTPPEASISLSSPSAPPVSTVVISSSPWPTPVFVASPVALPPANQPELDRKRLANNRDRTSTDKELVPLQVSYSKINEAQQPKTSSSWFNTHGLLVLGIGFIGTSILFLAYHRARRDI